jgi:hypothetical protein
MDIYTILSWTGLPFLLLAFYPEVFRFLKSHNNCFTCTFSVLNLLTSFIFTLSTLLQFLNSSFYSQPTLCELIFAVHSTIVCGIYQISTIEYEYNFFQNVTWMAKYITIFMWTPAFVFFFLFLEHTELMEFDVEGSKISNWFFIEVLIVLPEIYKYANFHKELRESDTLENISGLMIGSFLMGYLVWGSGIVYEAYWTGPVFLLKNIAKSAIAGLGFVFWMTVVLSKVKKCNKSQNQIRYTPDSFYYYDKGEEYQHRPRLLS